MKKLIWSNISRRRNQSILTIVITAVTILTFVAVLGICTTMDKGLALSRRRLGADMVLLPEFASMNDYDLIFTANPENVYMPMEVVEKVKNIEGIEACSPQFYSQTISGASCCSVGVDIRVIGFDPKTDFILAPYFAQKDFDTLEHDEIVVGSNFANYAASSFIILGQQFKVAGELYPTGTGMDNTIFMNIDVARRVTAESEAMKDEWKDRDVNDFISVVMVKLKDGTDPAAFKKMLYKENLSVQCVATGSTIASLQDQLGVTMRILVMLWVALLITAALSLFGRFNAMVRERRKEIGLMRALGVKKKRIFGLIVGEAMVMAAIGGLGGGILGGIAVGPIMEELQKAFYITTSLWGAGTAALCCLAGLLLACALGFFAAIIPACKSAALEPQTAIMRGDIN